MQRSERSKLLVLLLLQLLWGLVLWFSISRYGPGVSTDSVQLLFGGQNLASGNGLTSHDGTPVTLWPPLYPMILALVKLTTRLGMLGGAALVQAAAFVGLSLSLSVLLLKVFAHNFVPAMLATVLVQAGSGMVLTFGMVGSDYVHLFLVVAFLVLVGQHIATGSGWTFVAMAVAAALATMQRYIGAASPISGALAILLLTKGSWRDRVTKGLILLSSMVPMLVWLGMTSRLHSLRGPISLDENFSTFSRSILEWFAGFGAANRVLDQYTPLLWLGIALSLAVVIWLSPRSSAETRGPDERSYLLPVLIYAGCYVGALFGSASVAYFNKLAGRLLLPLYVPLMVILTVAVDLIAQRASAALPRVPSRFVRGLCYIPLWVLLLLMLRTTVPLVVESHANGVADGENVFNDRTWRENPALVYLRENPPAGDSKLLSNEPDGVALVTEHAVQNSPRRRSGPYATDEFPLPSYGRSLFNSNRAVYLVWIESRGRDYYFTPEELAEIASLEPLLLSDEGSVYRLTQAR